MSPPCSSTPATGTRSPAPSGRPVSASSSMPHCPPPISRSCAPASTAGVPLHRPGERRVPTMTASPSWKTSSLLDAEFKAAGRIALLGMGADPGTTNVYAAYAAKHLLDVVTELRIRDGDNSVCQGHDGFVAAFSPWVFIDECLCKAVSFRDGRRYLEDAAHRLRAVRFPRARRPQLLLRGPRGVQDAAQLLPRRPGGGLQALHGRRDRRDPPRDEAAGALRQGPGPRGRRPQSRPATSSSRCCPIRRTWPDGCAARPASAPWPRASRTASPRAFYIYNVADHETAYTELGVQATAYQTGIPPVIAARLIHEGRWAGPGVRSPEEFDPDPFLERLGARGHALARPRRLGPERASQGPQIRPSREPWRRRERTGPADGHGGAERQALRPSRAFPFYISDPPAA